MTRQARTGKTIRKQSTSDIVYETLREAILMRELPGGTPLEIPPVAGTLVTFLSQELEHEVLPARRERRSAMCGNIS